MFVLRFTQALLKDMKVTPIMNEEVSSLFNWHVNIYYINKRKHIIFVNDLSRLCVIIDGVRSSQLNLLKEKFCSSLYTYLISIGIKQSLIDSYIKDGTEMIISKTNSRSIIGTMTEMMLYTEDSHLEFNDNIERFAWLNRLIYKPIDYKHPKDVFAEAILTHYDSKF